MLGHYVVTCMIYEPSDEREREREIRSLRNYDSLPNCRLTFMLASVNLPLCVGSDGRSRNPPKGHIVRFPITYTDYTICPPVFRTNNP